MKKIFNILAVLFVMSNLGISQTVKSTKPVKKVVTSKITKDPKTGKVVKTITTVTTTDQVLVPGKQPTNTNSTTKQAIAKKQPVNNFASTKKPISKPKVVVAYKKSMPKSKTLVIKPKVSPAKVAVSEKEDNGSIFSNPSDHSAQNIKKTTEEKPELNAPAKKSPTTQNTTQNSAEKGKSKTPTKIFKENPNTIKLYLGIRGGANFANVENVASLTSIASPTISNKLGLNGGIFLNLGIGKLFSIQPEVNFSQQGYSVTNGVDTEKLKNQMINVPILMKITIGGANIKGFINGGPYIGYMLKSEKNIYINGQSVTNLVDFESDATKEINTNRVDYGVQAGAGFQIDLGGPKLEFEGRYNYGFADPMNYTGTKPSYIGETGRNRIITGSIGLMFPLGK